MQGVGVGPRTVAASRSGGAIATEAMQQRWSFRERYASMRQYRCLCFLIIGASMKSYRILIGVAALLALLNLTGCVLVPYDAGYRQGQGYDYGHRHGDGHGYRHHHDWRRDDRR